MELFSRRNFKLKWTANLGWVWFVGCWGLVGDVPNQLAGMSFFLVWLQGWEIERTICFFRLVEGIGSGWFIVVTLFYKMLKG